MKKQTFSNKLKKKTIQFLKIALPLFLGVFLIWYSYNKFTPEQLQEIKNYFKDANYGYVALSILFGTLSNLSRAYRWNFMLAPLGYKPKFKNNVMAVYITYLMNLFIPRSGEVSRALVIHKYENVPFDKAFGTIISERIADFVILLMLIGITLSLQFSLLTNFLMEKVDPSKIHLGMVLLLILASIMFVYLKKSNSAISKKINIFLFGLKVGILSIFKMKQKGAFIFHTLFIWIMYLLMYYVVVFALEDTASITFGAIITSFVVGSMTIAFTNGGFGSYPFFIAGILVLFGIPETAGTAFGWIMWTSQTAMIILFGGLSFLLLPVLNKAK
ncbi:MAG: TIGR00374 family protein [Bacteroidetes bacterium HGW-Bacteroidetes-2]|jgi:hypothetical protein|nr:MAG: TIGR00374 family protein [Bacteroidetes bacterium HGW-Bacteroidetes-2]